ncbi:MAG: thiamine pyrophosphate-binding protein [Nanoarchaeota archaeon]|nr:thiamine pyrophosphate-binding protein [Nanoarchaeota archaeon]MBU1501591.1 thiamine pyrophosphate-binding protein [Nanoarchaeota archaeon]
MKTSEYILNHFKEEGVKYAFGITGGVIAPMMDAFDPSKNLELICTAQEQGAATAAEAYSRITQNLGVALATSGPGAINLLNGVGCAYFDSIPIVCITGQVNPNESTWEGGPRQLGFQETDIVRMVGSITKYAVRVDDPKTIRYELEKSIYLARSGRPGPVLLDLPFNTQMAEMDEQDLRSYDVPKQEVDYDLLNKKVDQTIDLIRSAERPVLILGAGVKIGRAQKRTRDLIERLGIPVTPSWGAMDVLPHDNPLFIGGFGVSHGRSGNFAVQNSDLMISLGSRLDTRQTGAKRETFARGAKKVVLDLDKGELYKGRGMVVDVDLPYDINDFLDSIEKKDLPTRDISEWKKRIKTWKENYPICLPEYFNQKDKVNPYVFMDALSDESKEGDIIIPDAGGNLTWTMQGWKVKEGQRLFSAFGHSPMGYAPQAAMGASLASGKGSVTCIVGDGGLKMGIHELETIVRHDLPVKVFLINNHEFGIIKGFQDGLFESRYKATCFEGGLGDTDLLKVARAYGVPTSQINNHGEMRPKIREVLNYEGSIVCSVELKHGEKIMPKAGFGKPIEDSVPLLSREEFNGNMIVPPV